MPPSLWEPCQPEVGAARRGRPLVQASTARGTGEQAGSGHRIALRPRAGPLHSRASAGAARHGDSEEAEHLIGMDLQEIKPHQHQRPELRY